MDVSYVRRLNGIGAVTISSMLIACSSSASAPAQPAAPIPQNFSFSTARTLAATSDARVFTVTSATFANQMRVPESMVYNGTAGNVCKGDDRSPELSWKNAPAGTKSFAVTAYDTTASFTHWGIYDLASSTTKLPENAGAAGSTAGKQVANDFGNRQYDGPCPPPGRVHHYVFTVYALDVSELHLTVSPTGASLFRAMIGHTLGKAIVVGLYST